MDKNAGSGSGSGFVRNTGILTSTSSVVDWRLFVTDPDPDPIFILIPIQIRILIIPEVLHIVGKSEFTFTVIHSSASYNCYIFLVCVIGVIVFNIFDSILKFSGKSIDSFKRIRIDRL